MPMPMIEREDFNEHDIMFVRMMIKGASMSMEMLTKEYHMGKNKQMTGTALKMYGMQKDMIGEMRQWLAERKLEEIPNIDQMSMEME